MQTISEQKELRRAVEKWRTSRATQYGPVPHNDVSGKSLKLSSVNQGQTNNRTVKADGSEPDRVASPGFAAALVVLLAILYALAWFAPKL